MLVQSLSSKGISEERFNRLKKASWNMCIKLYSEHRISKSMVLYGLRSSGHSEEEICRWESLYVSV